MPFQVTYTHFDGSQQTAIVEQDGKEAAADLLGIDPDRISKIAPANASFLTGLTQNKPSLAKQRLALTSLLVRLKSGRNGGDYLNELAAEPFYKTKLSAVKGALNISDKLRILGFDPFLVLLVGIGEKTNQLVSMTESAIADMVLRGSLTKERRKQLITPLILGAMGTVYFVLIPIAMVPRIKTNMESGYANIEANAFTDLAFWLSTQFLENTFTVLGLLAALFAGLFWGIKNVPNVMPFSLFHNAMCARRGVDFATTYPALYAAGYTEVDALAAIEVTQSGETKKIYGELIEHVRAGKSIGTGFKDEQWTPLFLDVARSLSDIKPAQTKNYFDEVVRDLVDDYSNKSGKITKLVAVISLSMLATSLLMLVVGLYFPMAVGGGG